VVDSSETPFLLLACDGVWDVLSDDEACALVLEAWGKEVRAWIDW
jgi:serine/threonine protein phosphatase PrpC